MYKRNLKYDYDKIYQRHFEGESLSNISKDLGIHIQTIYAYFQRNNLTYNKKIQLRKEGYTVNDNYLDNIDTEDKAYFLGWLLSDGSISDNRLTLKLKSDDEYIIKEMFGKFSSGYNITTYKNSKSMGVSSSKLIDSLKKLGCVENKTKMGFNLPIISDDLFRHFIRGYFDGDGSIGRRSARPNQTQINICSPDKIFLLELQNKFNEFNINTIFTTEVRKGKLLKRPNNEYSTNNMDMFRLIINTHKDRLKFYEFLYNDCSIKLIRKYNLYTEYYNNTISLLESKISKSVQHIKGKIIINYDLIKDNTFQLGKEVDNKLILELFKSGKNEFYIHKETNIGRSVINRIIKEANPMIRSSMF